MSCYQVSLPALLCTLYRGSIRKWSMFLIRESPVFISCNSVGSRKFVSNTQSMAFIASRCVEIAVLTIYLTSTCIPAPYFSSTPSSIGSVEIKVPTEFNDKPVIFGNQRLADMVFAINLTGNYHLVLKNIIVLSVTALVSWNSAHVNLGVSQKLELF